jgi:ankyrin repeat protein
MQKLLVPILLILTQHLSAQTPATAQAPPSGLFASIRSGSSAAVQQQLSAGASPNDTLDGYSALMAATLCGTAQQMQLLIDHGANVNYENAQHITALWLAVPDRQKTALLLDHAADPNHPVEGYTVLVKCASFPGAADLLQLLIRKGADPKKSSTDNYLLYNAALSGDTAILGTVIRMGFKVNDTIAVGDYPINAAQLFRQFSTVKMLVDSGADVNARSMYFQTLPAVVGFTPLMNAALNADKPTILFLLDHGADPNLKSKTGVTALMVLQMSETDDPDLTLALLKHGAHLTDKTPDGTDALGYAAQGGHIKSAALLKAYSNR